VGGGGGRGVKYVFLGLWQQLCCQAESKKKRIMGFPRPDGNFVAPGKKTKQQQQLCFKIKNCKKNIL
jgi:hypothetical protein